MTIMTKVILKKKKTFSSIPISEVLNNEKLVQNNKVIPIGKTT